MVSFGAYLPILQMSIPTKMNKLESQVYRGRKKFVQNCNSLAKLFEMEGYFGRVTFDKASESWKATHWRPST